MQTKKGDFNPYGDKKWLKTDTAQREGAVIEKDDVAKETNNYALDAVQTSVKGENFFAWGFIFVSNPMPVGIY